MNPEDKSNENQDNQMDTSNAEKDNPMDNPPALRKQDEGLIVFDAQNAIQSLNDKKLNVNELLNFCGWLVDVSAKAMLVTLFLKGVAFEQLKKQSPHGDYLNKLSELGENRKSIDNARRFARTVFKCLPNKRLSEIIVVIQNVETPPSVFYEFNKIQNENEKLELFSQGIGGKLFTVAEAKALAKSQAANKQKTVLITPKTESRAEVMPELQPQVEPTIQTTEQTQKQSERKKGSKPHAELKKTEEQIQSENEVEEQLQSDLNSPTATDQTNEENKDKAEEQAQPKNQPATLPQDESSHSKQPQEQPATKVEVQQPAEPEAKQADEPEEKELDPLDELEDQKNCLRNFFTSVKPIFKQLLDNPNVLDLNKELDEFMKLALKLAENLEEFKNENLPQDNYSEGEE